MDVPGSLDPSAGDNGVGVTGEPSAARLIILQVALAALQP